MNLASPPRLILMIFVAAFLLSEIVLLRQNILLKKQISQAVMDARSNKKKIGKIQKQSELEGMNVPFFLMEAIQKSRKEISRYIILFVYTPNSCDPCVQHEMALWSEFSDEYSSESHVQVIGVTESKYATLTAQLRKKSEIRFSVVPVDDLGTKLKMVDFDFTPMILFVDSTSTKIVFAFFPETIEKSDVWFVDKLRRFLSNSAQTQIINHL